MNALHGIATTKAHIALNVADVQRSIAFYTALFGIVPSKSRPGYAKFDVDNPPLNLTLNQAPPSTSGALSHLGVQVPTTAEVTAIRDGWRRAGLEPRDEMNVSCCYALQDKAWVNDPDGNEWEVFTVLQDNLAEHGSSTCCVVETAPAAAAPATAAPAAAPAAATAPRMATADPAASTAGSKAAVACCDPGCCAA